MKGAKEAKWKKVMKTPMKGLNPFDLLERFVELTCAVPPGGLLLRALKPLHAPFCKLHRKDHKKTFVPLGNTYVVYAGPRS